MPRLRLLAVAVAIVSLGSLSSPARAYDKEGEPVRERAAGPKGRLPNQDFTGYFFIGGFAFQQGVPARPDNTGGALLRFGEHLDVDLYRRWLTLSYAANFVIDAETIALTGYDQLVGLNTFIPLQHGFAVRLGAQYQYNRSLAAARSDYVQRDLSVWGRIQWESPRWFGYVSLSGFPWNPSLAARPDNTGLALLRYRGHLEYSLTRWLAVAADVSALTDGQASGAARAAPSEVDTALELIGKMPGMELRVIGEFDTETTHPTDAQRWAARDWMGEPRTHRAMVMLLADFPFDLRSWWGSNLKSW